MLIRVVLVGEDPQTLARLETVLSTSDVVVARHLAPEEFWRHPGGQDSFDLVIVGRGDLPADVGGALRRIRKLAGQPEVVVHDSQPEPGATLDLQAAGVFAILPGGLSDPQFDQVLGQLIARRREVLSRRLQADLAVKPRLTNDPFSSRDPAIQQMLRMARRVAASDTSLLLLGETGAGKDWLARAIHAESARQQAPFIAFNCSAVPESLLESELFGHVRGAFSGAVKDRRGYFELAHRGTLFLDEIGEMPAHLQVKLLRVLQDYTIQRLGSEGGLQVDVRVIAATNRDIVAAMKAGDFRQDLYYRLAVVSLTVPPLRERLEDLTDLIEIFLARLTKKLARADITGITPQALEALRAYDWPGNVRELANVLERAVLLADGPDVGVGDLPVEIGSQHGIALVDEAAAGTRPSHDLTSWFEGTLETGRLTVVADFERRYLTHNLRRFGGSVGKTARHAGIDPRTLYSKMRQFGLRKEDFKAK